MAIHGKGGNLSVGGTNIANLESWTLNKIGETGEATSMGDTWATFLAGLTDFNATAEGKSQVGLDTTDLLATGDTGVFSTASGGAGYTGGVIITGVTETASIEELITISYTFEGNDASGLTYGPATGTAPTASTNVIHGKAIDAEYASASSFSDIQGWTITMSVPVHDATVAHASNHGRQKVAGISTATATVTTLAQSGGFDIETGGTASELNLWREDGTAATGYYTGEAVCTGIEPGVSITGVETVTYSFIYNGVVDLATT